MTRRNVIRPSRKIALALVLGGALALGGCGVKGPLEPPPNSPMGQPGPDGKKPKDTGPIRPDKPFILDGLL
ncbi:LPS translocon maturation chaperone LptM [Ancylobacter amanitiformis]|uniref:Small lipoprotein YifL n=1 Tax=Ancylobacter amanitiformis TaxID=217069 RepID=A0ABU0LRM0_9HYPH|nr:lipoprotein [Ancylobacter amanitiformis]MDQ0511352.1 putative small lipoprotein YifL [Ancylobacter amanitiformis]